MQTDGYVRRASEQMVSTYGAEAWFVATDLAVVASRAGNPQVAELCVRIADAIEALKTRPSH